MLPPHLRKIEIEHLELTLQGSRMLSDPQIAKELLELILVEHIIVSMKHTDEHALAETARANEKQVVSLVLQQWEIHSLIDVVLVSADYLDEIRHTIRYSFHLFQLHVTICFLKSLFYICRQSYNFLLKLPKNRLEI